MRRITLLCLDSFQPLQGEKHSVHHNALEITMVILNENLVDLNNAQCI